MDTSNGADGFMGVLGAALGLVHTGALGQVILAEVFANKFLGRVPGLIGNARGVRTHIGDKGGKAAVAQLHAFIGRWAIFIVRLAEDERRRLASLLGRGGEELEE